MSAIFAGGTVDLDEFERRYLPQDTRLNAAQREHVSAIVMRASTSELCSGGRGAGKTYAALALARYFLDEPLREGPFEGAS